MLIRKTRTGANRGNLYPTQKSKRYRKEASWSEIVHHSMIIRLHVGQADCCRTLRWQRSWACLEARIDPPHNSAALIGAFGLENVITKDRFVATHVHSGTGPVEGKLRSNTHISDFHDVVCDNGLSRAIEQELPRNILWCIIVRPCCSDLCLASSSLIGWLKVL